MKKRFMILAGAALAIVLLGATLVVPALAQEETPTPEAPLGCHGGGFGFWGGSWTMFDTMAEALGLSPDEFFAELHAGKTLEEIAEAQGVELEAVQEAMNAARADAMREAIEQAVEDGNITQEQADWLLEGLEQGFFPMGRGFGFGHGMKGGFGRGMRGSFGGFAPQRAPSTSTVPSSSSL
jgi:ABC-type sugar transport system substrate-binding protein